MPDDDLVRLAAAALPGSASLPWPSSDSERPAHPCPTERMGNDAAGFASCYGPHRHSSIQTLTLGFGPVRFQTTPPARYAGHLADWLNFCTSHDVDPACKLNCTTETTAASCSLRMPLPGSPCTPGTVADDHRALPAEGYLDDRHLLTEFWLRMAPQPHRAGRLRIPRSFDLRRTQISGHFGLMSLGPSALAT